MKKTLLSLTFFCFSCLSYGQYYNSALGFNGVTLKSKLHNIITNHTDVGWPLWSYFNTIDVRNTNKIWDMYSDIPMSTPPYTFTVVTGQCGTYNSEGDCYNHEHTWPSNYFNDAQPMRTDLHHVFPTDGYVNNKRSSYPYGKTNSANWTSDNGSKLGSSTSYSSWQSSNPNHYVFEPIDEYKGDLARAYFYMATRYFGEDSGWLSWEMANGADLTSSAITLLLQWHHNDTVSQKEKDRNDAIFGIQGNRNPFIDYPIFADCIWGNADCTALNIVSNSINNSVKIYPNPAQDNVHVVLPNTVEVIKTQVYTIYGSKVSEFNSMPSSLPLNGLSAGMYVLKLETNQGNLHKTFIKD